MFPSLVSPPKKSVHLYKDKESDEHSVSDLVSELLLPFTRKTPVLNAFPILKRVSFKGEKLSSTMKM